MAHLHLTPEQCAQDWIVFGAVCRFRYTNWKEETADRVVIPHCLRFGEVEFHPGRQWLLEAYDCEKQALRTFALKDIEPR